MEHIQPKLYHHLHEQCHLFKKYCHAPLGLSKTNQPFNFAMKCKLRAHFFNPHKEKRHDFKIKFKQTHKQKFKVKLIKDKIKRNI
jgi:hypothetical protein